MFRTALLLLSLLAFSFAQDKSDHMKIAVLNLKNANGITVEDAELISDRLRNEFYSTGKVDVMEREQMQTLLKEQGFQQSGAACTDEGCMVEMGRLLGVKRLIIGSVGKLGSLYMINIRGINVETGSIEKVVSRDVKGSIEDLVNILPQIAGIFTGTVSSQVKTAVPEKRRTEEPEAKTMQVSSQIQKEQPEKDTLFIDCRESILMEKITFTSSDVKFKTTAVDFDEINEDISDAISEAIDEDITVVSPAQLSNVNCNVPVFRISIKSYKTSPSHSNQIEGTLKIAVSLYKSPKSTTPMVSVIFQETGSPHWGNETPLMNAFEAVAEEIEDDLDDDIDSFLE